MPINNWWNLRARREGLWGEVSAGKWNRCWEWPLIIKFNILKRRQRRASQTVPATEAEADPERTRIRRMVRLDSIERQEVERQNASVCACVHIHMHVPGRCQFPWIILQLSPILPKGSLCSLRLLNGSLEFMLMRTSSACFALCS